MDLMPTLLGHAILVVFPHKGNAHISLNAMHQNQHSKLLHFVKQILFSQSQWHVLSVKNLLNIMNMSKCHEFYLKFVKEMNVFENIKQKSRLIKNV